MLRQVDHLEAPTLMVIALAFHPPVATVETSCCKVAGDDPQPGFAMRIPGDLRFEKSQKTGSEPKTSVGYGDPKIIDSIAGCEADSNDSLPILGHPSRRPRIRRIRLRHPATLEQMRISFGDHGFNQDHDRCDVALCRTTDGGSARAGFDGVSIARATGCNLAHTRVGQCLILVPLRPWIASTSVKDGSP